MSPSTEESLRFVLKMLLAWLVSHEPRLVKLLSEVSTAALESQQH